MYVCVYIYIYIYIHIHTYTHTYTHTYVIKHMCTYINIYGCVPNILFTLGRLGVHSLIRKWVELNRFSWRYLTAATFVTASLSLSLSLSLRWA